MSSQINAKPFDLLFSFGTSLSPEVIISGLCKTIDSSWEVELQNKQKLENKFNLISTLLSTTKWKYENASGETTANIKDLFLLILQRYLNENNRNIDFVVTFLKSCCNLSDTENYYCKELTKSVVTCLESICFDLKRNKANSVWNEHIDHTVFLLLDKLVENKYIELFSHVFPRLCEILVWLKGVSPLYNITLRLISNMTQLLSKSSQGEDLLKMSLMQVFDRICQQSQTEITKKLHTNESEDFVENAEVIGNCISLLQLLLELWVSCDECSTKKNSVEEVLLHVVSDYRTWCILQMGIYHRTSSTRKAAVNCIRYAFQFVQTQNLEITVKIQKSCALNENDTVFASTNNVHWFAAWQHLLTVCESLEENQIHVIRPVLVKIPGLFAIEKDARIPLSWLLAILRRMLSHDSKHVQQEGIELFLQLNHSTYPVFSSPFFFSFIYFGLLPALQDESVYYCSGQEAAENTISVSKMVGDFFKTTCESLPQHGKETFLKILLTRLDSFSWSPVALFYMMSSATKISPVNCWGDKELHMVRHLMFHSVRSQNKQLNSTLQKVILQCFLIHADVSKIMLEDLLSFLLLCVKEQVLSRPSKQWNECSKWLWQNFKNIKQESDSGQFQPTISSWFKQIFGMTGDCQEQGAIDTSINQCDIFLLLIFLYADGQCSNNDKLQPMEFIFQNITTQVKAISDKAAMHPYLPHLQIVLSFHFTKSLLTFCMTAEKGDPIVDIILTSLWQIWPGLAAYVMRKLPSSCLAVNRLEIYLCPTQLFFELSEKHSHNKCSVLGLGQNVLAALILSSILAAEKVMKNKIDESSLRALSVAYKTIDWACKMSKKHSVKLPNDCLEKLTSFLASLAGQFQSLALLKQEPNLGANKMREMNDMLWWSLVPLLFNPSLNLQSRNMNGLSFLTLAVDCVHTTSFDNLPHLFTVCKTLLGEVCGNTKNLLSEETGTTCRQCIRLLWKTTIDLQNSSIFRPLYKTMVYAIFQKSVLFCTSEPVLESVKYVLDKIQAVSYNKPLLLVEVVTALSKVCQQMFFSPNRHEFNVLKSVSNVTDNAVNGGATTRCLELYVDFIVHCATFSHIPSKTMLLTDQALLFAKQLAVDVGPTDIIDKSAEINLRSSSLLLRLANNDSGFGSICLQRLVDLEKQADKKSKARCHLNSVTHFTKQKLWQNFLLLLPHAHGDCGNQLVKETLGFLNENLQASIRHFVEWCLTLLLVRYPTCDGLLFQYLRDNSTENVSFPAICSCLTVALLLGIAKQKSSAKFQPHYYLKLFDTTIPWCMTQHFTIRLCAHAVLLRIHHIFVDNGKLDLLKERFSSLDACLQFADNSSGNVKKNWELIKESPVLFYLDPLADLSLETIFCSFPRLCHVTCPDVSMLDKWMTVSTWMPLRNTGTTLRCLPKPLWLSSKSSKTEKLNAGERCEDKSADLNLQKKIVVGNISKKQSGFVLVASLIDKPSNLGGLTRTCEVFGADRLVVHSLSCVDDKFYQSLSVTAHKWLRMDEVKRWNLEQYLVDMKTDGYTLIGTEQTEQSKCLSKYKFPKKCVVLLGNEKEGIPPALLRRLDVCLEIPQVGVVRSLNVHVSGAITVWEYAKQLRFTEADTTS